MSRGRQKKYEVRGTVSGWVQGSRARIEIAAECDNGAPPYHRAWEGDGREILTQMLEELAKTIPPAAAVSIAEIQLLIAKSMRIH